MIKMIAVGTGIVILLVSLCLRSVRKMTVNVAAVWGITGFLFIAAGIIPGISDWVSDISTELGILLPAAGVICLAGGFWLSVVFSEAVMRSQEQALRDSLLKYYL